MGAAEDYEHLRHLVEQLSPDQAPRLLALVRSDPEFSRLVEETAAAIPAIERPGFAAFVGMGRSGHTDTARRHRELVQEWSDEDR